MKRLVLIASLILCISALQFSPSVGAVAAHYSDGDWFFVVVETHVHPSAVEVSNEHPEERRWYISNVVSLPANIPSYSDKKKVGEYFDANVVEPAKKNGIAVDYFDQELEINGGSVLAMKSRAEAEDARQKDVEEHKEQGGNIYSFNVTFGPAKGEETSQPHLVYRSKDQPNYEAQKKP
jgi:hypothetical protein